MPTDHSSDPDFWAPYDGHLTVDPERTERMWAMSPAARLLAARRGDFTLGELLKWASRAPHEVPMVNGEFAFIALLTADADAERPATAASPAGERRQ
jgi:hypothetical protein